MFELAKHAVNAAVVIAVASAPSAAFARVDLHLSQAQLAQLESYEQALVTQLGPTPGGLAGPVVRERLASTPAAVTAGAPPPGGFHWDDAGLGAAAMLVFLGLGAGSATFIRRNRSGQSQAG